MRACSQPLRVRFRNPPLQWPIRALAALQQLLPTADMLPKACLILVCTTFLQAWVGGARAALARSSGKQLQAPCPFPPALSCRLRSGAGAALPKLRRRSASAPPTRCTVPARCHKALGLEGRRAGVGCDAPFGAASSHLPHSQLGGGLAVLQAPSEAGAAGTWAALVSQASGQGAAGEAQWVGGAQQRDAAGRRGQQVRVLGRELFEPAAWSSVQDATGEIGESGTSGEHGQAEEGEEGAAAEEEEEGVGEDVAALAARLFPEANAAQQQQQQHGLGYWAGSERPQEAAATHERACAPNPQPLTLLQQLEGSRRWVYDARLGPHVGTHTQHQGPPCPKAAAAPTRPRAACVQAGKENHAPQRHGVIKEPGCASNAALLAPQPLVELRGSCLNRQPRQPRPA